MRKIREIKFILIIILFFGVGKFYGQDSKIVRDDVTFILGEDKEGDNLFYAHAENYYRYNEIDRTEEVITNFHSLAEVQTFLIQNAPRNGKSWGQVNLVTHGNPYVGLSAKIQPDGDRASAESIWEAFDECVLVEMPENLFDEHSVIEIHGCGLGHNEELVKALRTIFSSDCYNPDILVSKLFEYYLANPDDPKAVKQMQADFWTINYKFGYRPTDKGIYNRFNSKYPNEKIDWKEAVKKESAAEVGEVFYYTYDVPVKWVLPFPRAELVPNLTTKSDRLKWVKQQPQFLEYLEKLQIPPENFNWWMRRVIVENTDGTTSPALWVKGHSTLFCVLKLKDPIVN